MYCQKDKKVSFKVLSLLEKFVVKTHEIYPLSKLFNVQYSMYTGLYSRCLELLILHS